MSKPEKSYNQALALVDKHPDLQLIISPTAVGTPAAAEACRKGNYAAGSRSPDSDPTEMVSVKNGCALAFALWSFKDLGYLAYYTTHMLATGSLKMADGASFTGRYLGKSRSRRIPCGRTDSASSWRLLDLRRRQHRRCREVRAPDPLHQDKAWRAPMFDFVPTKRRPCREKRCL